MKPPILEFDEEFRLWFLEDIHRHVELQMNQIRLHEQLTMSLNQACSRHYPSSELWFQADRVCLKINSRLVSTLQ